MARRILQVKLWESNCVAVSLRTDSYKVSTSRNKLNKQSVLWGNHWRLTGQYFWFSCDLVMFQNYKLPFLPYTMFVPFGGAQTWCLHTKLYKFRWHTSLINARMKKKAASWRGCLYSNRLSYPRFLTLFIEWVQFLVLITWLVKTENSVLSFVGLFLIHISVLFRCIAILLDLT